MGHAGAAVAIHKDCQILFLAQMLPNLSKFL
jgi:hypothetical protein